jgi:hypothetical protein
MGNTVGSIRKVVIDGVTYDVIGDANAKHNASRFETEGVATSGKTMMKMKKRVPTIESVDLATFPADMVALKAKAESLADVTLSIEYADGSIFKSSGRINFESWESESGKSAVMLIPSKDWTEFLAP